MNSFSDSIDAFKSHCRFEKNLSFRSIKAYITDLTQLTNFLTDRGEEGISEINQLTKVELRAYLEFLSGLKPRSIKRKVATIKLFLNFLEFEDIIQSNPMRQMKIKIKESKMLPKVMDVTEIEKVLRQAYMEFQDVGDRTSYSYAEALRNIIIIELLFATGARVSEIANLRAENIDVLTGAITIKGKGNKERIIQICSVEVLKILQKYYAVFEEKIRHSKDYFLINRLGNKLTDQSIRNTVNYLAKEAGIERHITPHMFRHTFATLLLERDVDIKYIQSLLGHSSIMTTQIYTHVNREKQIRILEEKHPRKTFSMRDPCF